MSHRRKKDDPRALGGVDSDYEHLFLSAWGLQPAQWRPVGSMAIIRQRAYAVLVGSAPGDQLRILRREISSHRRSVELIIGDDLNVDPLTAIRARLRPD